MRNSLKKRLFAHLYSILVISCTFALLHKNKVPMNKPYNIQNICNGIFHISFFKALLINEGETTRGERE
jgi:hypothetical protein